MVACSGPRHLLHIPRWRFLVGCGAILPPSPGNIIYPRARASNVRTLRLGLPLLLNCCKIDLAAALEHLSVSAGRAVRWQEGANLRTAVNLRSLMAMFEALEVLERQVFDAPNLADADRQRHTGPRLVMCTCSQTAPWPIMDASRLWQYFYPHPPKSPVLVYCMRADMLSTNQVHSPSSSGLSGAR